MLELFLDTPDNDELELETEDESLDLSPEPESGQADNEDASGQEPRRGDPSVALRKEREEKRLLKKELESLRAEQQRWEAYQRHTPQPQQEQLDPAVLNEKLLDFMANDPVGFTRWWQEQTISQQEQRFQQQYGWLQEEKAAREANKAVEYIANERPEYAHVVAIPDFKEKLSHALQYADDPRGTAEWLAGVYDAGFKAGQAKPAVKSRMGSTIGNNTRLPKRESGAEIQDLMSMNRDQLEAYFSKQ